MKLYKLNKNMLYKLIIVCFLFLYLTGCDASIFRVEPKVLDFGESEDLLSFKLTPVFVLEDFFVIKWDATWVIDVEPDDGFSSVPTTIHVRVSRDGLDPGEYSEVLEIETIPSHTVVATVTVKMTVPGDDDYTTTTTIPISTSTTTTSIFVGDPPTIHSISFPDEIIADGEGNYGTVSFSDPDGDIVRAYFERVSGSSFSSFDIDPMEWLEEGDATDGTFGFGLWCTGSTRYIELEVTLKDQAGNMSNSETFGFTCTEEE